MEEENKIPELQAANPEEAVKMAIEKKIVLLINDGVLMAPAVDENGVKDLVDNKDQYKEILGFYDKFKDMDLPQLAEELNKINSREDVEKLLGIKKEQEEPESKITLDNVKDITKDGAEYISIHLPGNEIKLVENHSKKSAKEIFEENKDSVGTITVDGFVNSVDVFNQSVEPEKIDVKTFKLTEILENDKIRQDYNISNEKLEAVYDKMLNVLAEGNPKRKESMKESYINNNNYPNGVIKDYGNVTGKEAYFSPEVDLVIFAVPDDPSKDEINYLSLQNGKYKCEKIGSENEKSYSYDEGTGENQRVEQEDPEFNYEEKGPRLSLFDERRRRNKNERDKAA